MFKFNGRAQSTAEYAIVIGLVIAAVVAMQVYLKRGVQAKVKDAADYTVTEDKATGKTPQYEPYYATSSITSTRTGEETTVATQGGKVVTRTIGAQGEKSIRKGSQTTLGAENNP